MRRLSALLLLCIYVALASGLCLHLHFCSGAIKSISVLGKSDACCKETSCHSSGLHKSCCDDTYLYLGSEVPYARPEVFVTPFLFPAEPEILIVDASDYPAKENYFRQTKPAQDSFPPPYIAFSSLKYCA
jgi:hypothetical protein